MFTMTPPLLRAGGRAHISLILIAIIACAGAFIGLDSSSLSLDELYTAYYSDSALPGFTAVLMRAAEDVHPPLYYMLVHLFVSLTDDFAVTSRAMSAVFAIAAIGVLYNTAREELSPAARAFVCAFAGTSWGWWRYAQEARSYALCFLLGSIMVYVAVEYRRKTIAANHGASHETGFNNRYTILVAMGCVSVFAAFAHYYMLLLAGAMFAYFLLTAPTWRDRTIIVVSGLAVLIPVAAYVYWHIPHMLVDAQDTLFAYFATAPILPFIEGLRWLFGSFGGLVIVITAIVLTGVHKIRNPRTTGVLRYFGTPAGMTLGIPMLMLAIALVLTVLWKPVFSPRIFLISMPFIWIFSGFLFDRLITRLNYPAWGLGFVLLALGSAHERLLDRTEPFNEEWRASALYVSSEAACQNAKLPVLVLRTMTPAGPEAADIFFGYYLRGSQREGIREFLTVSTDLALTGAWNSLIKTRIKDPQTCPVLLWAISDEASIRRVADRMRDTFTLPKGRSIEVVEFPNFLRDPLAVPFLSPRYRDARALIIRVGNAVP